MKILFLGPPGCGKGTQAYKLGKENNLKVIATGDILRNAIREDSLLGREVKTYVEKGELVPDDLMIALISNKLKSEKSFILDGFPRTIEQAKKLEKITNIDKIIYFNCTPDTIIHRLSNRRICPKCAKVYNLISNPPSEDELCDICSTRLEQREDDEEEVIRKRIEVYKSHASPLLHFYGSRVKIIDANKDIETVYFTLKEIIYG
jgi:adenylate kinase